MAMIESKTISSRIGTVLRTTILALFALCTFLPFLHLLAKSFSGEGAVVSGKVYLWPVDFTVDTYRFVFDQGVFFSALGVSVVLTLVGTVCALLVTTMTAYPLSRTWLRGRKAILYCWIFVMLFSGGMIPNYLLYKALNLMDTMGALVLPAMLNVTNLLIIKNYFETLPDELEEAARIDGASTMRVLFRIILPVSTPMLATIALFYAVGYWNDYFTAKMYITSPRLRPLQLYLFDLITTSQKVMAEGVEAQSVTADEKLAVTADSMRAAAIMLSTIPILLVYPMLQKYFVKGIVVGSVKG